MSQPHLGKVCRPGITLDWRKLVSERCPGGHIPVPENVPATGDAHATLVLTLLGVSSRVGGVSNPVIRTWASARDGCVPMRPPRKHLAYMASAGLICQTRITHDIAPWWLWGSRTGRKRMGRDCAHCPPLCPSFPCPPRQGTPCQPSHCAAP